MKTELEKSIIREEVLLTKEEILKRIKKYKKETNLAQEKEILEKLESSLKQIVIEEIPLDLDSEEIESYFVIIEEGHIYRSLLSDFFFEYDNKEHKLYLSSFSINYKNEPIV